MLFQLLVNELRNGQMKITDLDVVIMDECHHTDQSHPYAVIMEVYYTVLKTDSRARLPQIIGLTASIGVGSFDANPEEHYIHICANLNCGLINHVKENRRELEKHVPPLKRDQIIAVQPRNKDAPFYKVTASMMTEILEMEEMKGKVVCAGFGTQPFENWAVQVRF